MTGVGVTSRGSIGRDAAGLPPETAVRADAGLAGRGARGARLSGESASSVLSG